jgi:hypothetical protein
MTRDHRIHRLGSNASSDRKPAAKAQGKITLSDGVHSGSRSPFPGGVVPPRINMSRCTYVQLLLAELRFLARAFIKHRRSSLALSRASPRRSDPSPTPVAGTVGWATRYARPGLGFSLSFDPRRRRRRRRGTCGGGDERDVACADSTMGRSKNSILRMYLWPSFFLSSCALGYFPAPRRTSAPADLRFFNF